MIYVPFLPSFFLLLEARESQVSFEFSTFISVKTKQLTLLQTDERQYSHKYHFHLHELTFRYLSMHALNNLSLNRYIAQFLAYLLWSLTF